MFDRHRGNAAVDNEDQTEPAISDSINIVRQVTIGTTISIKGEVTGDEDLLIEGNVEGTIDLADFDLTIGQSGNVVADIRAKSITVQGRVEGDIRASQSVLITETARMVGNIKSPRVALEDGADFKGSIDMRDDTQPSSVAAAPTPINRDQSGRPDTR